MAKGTVKWYNDIKGYGFIQDESGTDIFVHRSGLMNKYFGLETGQHVQYETRQGEKGTMAVDVKVETE